MKKRTLNRDREIELRQRKVSDKDERIKLKHARKDAFSCNVLKIIMNSII